jgi:protein-S-isoprenylcysteine O-methyltransferase Ste14
LNVTSEEKTKLGFRHKPLVEKLKLIGLFLAIAALIYLASPTRNEFYIGAVLTVLGTLIRVWAGGHLTRDQKLTTSGPYQFTRNPFYLGRLFVLLGFGAMSGIISGGMSGSVPSIIGAVILIGALIIFFGFYMPRKERREGGRLRDLFGPDYEQWKSNVPSLFPRLTPYRMNPRPWSSKLFMAGDEEFSGNKELWTTIGTLALVALFYWRMVTLPGS